MIDAIRRLIAAQRASLTAPISRDFADAAMRLAAAADVPCPPLAWAVDGVRK